VPRLPAAALLLLVLLLAAGCGPGRIIRALDRAEVDMTALAERAARARAVFVGEEHGRGWHHSVELRVIRALDEAGIKTAIGMEMFMAEDQDDLDKWTAGDLAESELRKIYEKTWRLPWRKYRKILLYARERHIPVVGLNVSRDLVHRVFTRGIKALTPDELSAMPGIACDVGPAYEKVIRNAMEEHTIKDASFTNYCEAQMVWDSGMASNVLAYLEDHPQTTMVVIAGGAHSWRHGIPRQIRRRSCMDTLVIMPDMPGSDEMEEMDALDTDYIWLRW